MLLRSAARTDVGRRRSANEDCFAVASKLGLYLVADGMGGHAAGEVASLLASETVTAALKAVDSPTAALTDKLRHAVAAANRAIFARVQEKPELAGMGTTVVALLADCERVALAHVGDSRAYLVRDGRIRQLTRDHSMVAELVRRHEISAQDALMHPQRHVLTRALGVRRRVEVDLIEMALAGGDVLVLCSDGLTGPVRDEEIANEVDRTHDLEEVCGRLVDLANSRGGDDNITVVCVRTENG